ncbi:MAG: methyltransferase domain-containing protein [Flammeovirgaceae bacterium]
MVNLIIKTFKRYAWFKRFNAKITYELLAKFVPAEDWHFMNYGYQPNAEEPALQLKEQVLQRYPLQMYHYLAAKTSLDEKDVLEVGCGRGGGARYIASAMNPNSYVGLDLAQRAVDLANKIHKQSNLKFIQGSAEEIPVESDSMDVVINVESCHCYGSVDKFLSEVKRVLKPNCYLLLVDFRNEVKNMELLQQQIKNSGLKLLQEENISKNVIAAIEAENPAKVKRIEELIPKRWQKLFSDFAGVVGSRFYNTLKDGTRVYYRFVLQKV